MRQRDATRRGANDGRAAVRALFVAAAAAALLAIPVHAVVTAFTYIAPGPNGGNQQLPANRLTIPSFQIQIDTSNNVVEPFPIARFFDQAGTLRASPAIPRNTPSPSGDIPVFEGRTQLISFAESPLTPFPPGFPGPTVVNNRATFFDSDTGPPNHPQITGLSVTNGRVTTGGNRARIVYNAANKQTGPLKLSIAGRVQNIPRAGFTVANEVLATVTVDMVPVQFSNSIVPERTPKTTETGPALVPFSFPIPTPRLQAGEFTIDYEFTQVPDGVYELRFRATDVFNQQSPNDPPNQTILTIDKDTRAPNVVFSTPSQRPAFVIDGPNPKPPFQGDKFTVTGFASDERAQSTTITLEITNRSNPATVFSTRVTSVATIGSQPFTVNLDFSPGGPILSVLPPALPAPPTASQELYRIQARSTDQAGNRGAATDSVYIIRDFAPTVTPVIQRPPTGFATDARSVVVSGFVTNVIGFTNLEEHGSVDFEVTLQSAITPTIITTLVVPGLPDSNKHSSALDNGTTSVPSGPTYTTFPIDVLGRIPNSFSFFVPANVTGFPDGRIFITVRTIDQVGNISARAFQSYIKGPVGPKITLDFAGSGPDDNYDPISGFPPNSFGANDNIFLMSLKSPEIADNGTGVPVPVPPFTDPGTQSLLRVSGRATDINTPVARVEAQGAGVPTVSVSSFAVSTAVTFVFDPANSSGIDVSRVEEGVPTLVTFTGFNASGQSGVTSSILVIRDIVPARRPLIDFPAEQPFFTGQRTMRLEGRAEPGSLVAVMTPPTTGIFVLPIPRTLPNRIPRKDSQFNSLPPSAQTTVADPDGKWAFKSLNISTVATGVTQPTTIFIQTVDTFDNTDPVDSVEPFEIFRQDVPGDIVDITLDPFPGGRNVSIFPIPPSTPVFVGLEVLTFRVKYNTLLVAAPRMTVKQFNSQPRPTTLLSSVPSSENPTQVLLFRYEVLTTPDQFDGRADLDFRSGLDIFGRVPNPTPVAQAFIVDSVAPRLSVAGPQAFFPATGTQLTVVSTLAADLTDPVAANGSGTASGVNTTRSRVRLFGPLERIPTLEVAVTPITATSPFDVAARPVTPLATDGTYELRVEAEDRVGNSTIFTSTFILDRLSIPTPLISFDPADRSAVSTLPRFGPDAAVFTTIDNIQVSMPPPSVAGTPVSTARFLNPNRAAIGQSPVTTRVRTLAIPVRPPLAVDGSADGVYFIETDAVDQAGNKSPTATGTFTYDTVVPIFLDFVPAELSAVKFPLRETRVRVADGIPLVPNPFPLAQSGLDLDRTRFDLELVRPTFPNTTNPGTGIDTRRRFRTEPGSLIGTLPVEVVSAELLDNAGASRSLADDGTEDGVYAVKVTIFDRAGNSAFAKRTFTYDTQRPVLDIDDFPEGSFLADSSFAISGTVYDRGPAGFDRGAAAGTFVARTVQIRLEGVDAQGRVTTAPPFFDFRDADSVIETTGITPTIPVTTVARWSFATAIPRVNSPARLLLRATDRAGNRTAITRNISVRTAPLGPPELAAPPANRITRVLTTDFRWKAVNQARVYELELSRVSPATPRAVPNFLVDHPAVTLGPVDLVGFLAAAGATLSTTQDNVFEWRMRSIDVTRVNTGPFSAPSRFTVDLVRPVVSDVLVNNVSTGGNPTVGAGQLPVTVQIAETAGLDLRQPLAVNVQLADRSIPLQSVRFSSFTTTATGATWQGTLELPIPGIAADNNGAAMFTVRGGADLAGNAMPTVTAPFRINLGPAFDSRVFPNPVEPRELVLVVRSFPNGRVTTGLTAPVEPSNTSQILSVLESLTDPAAASLSTTPTVLVGQQGTLRLTRLAVTPVLGAAVPNSAFAATVRIEPGLIGVLDFQVTGTDLSGVTATRTFSLNVASVLTRARVTLQALRKGAELEVPAESAPERTALYWLPSENALDGVAGSFKSDSARTASGLRMVRDLGAFLPERPGLAGPAVLRVSGVPNQAKALPPSRRGLYRLEAGRWRFVSPAAADGAIEASLERLGSFALMEDWQAPAAGKPRLEPFGLEGPTFRASVADAGSGVEARSVAFEIDGQRHAGRLEATRNEVMLAVPAAIEPGEHRVRLLAADRAGNEAAGPEAMLHVAGYQGLGEVLAVPNPARRSPAMIRYRLLGAADSVRVRLFDAAGDVLATLDGPTAAGLQQVDFDIDAFENGVYLFRVEAAGAGHRDRKSGKLVVLR
ncbi:MAG: hypothetical protein HYY25_04500 [Candidatus Wallbacteria bacterium]|nr:hypothetical protein [Candidatus Wallbacteria bacterium]